ncbi:hypothetical protein ONE63_006580 [Megalurothrips usitatus]|uniref:RING-type domain-containing protein n=1 Tax=Megalurothrips usitatus TaxID=439358 RepID=A0AAV7XX16_9NEOP|nr:hypothetical protein ONE63_006580 [Megalurothrips usitatus]
MSKLESVRPARRRLHVTDLHPHLMCVLCGGYYVDATTIIECLHSFCKSCLVKYLESSKYCPICEVQVHKTKPLLNIRPDETLQNMVYKLVPGLYHREMKLRQEFYAQHPDAPVTNPEDRGVVDPIECQYYSPDEPVSLALEFKTDLSSSSNNNGVYKRYLRCPAAVTIAHLQKLVRNKYGLSTSYNVDVMFDDKLLTSDFSIMDVAYTFQRKRKEQFHFTYRIVEIPCKKRKLEELEPVERMNVDPPPPPLPPPVSTAPVKASSTPPQESKSKLDSIISRLGSAKKTGSGLKKDESGKEWKEVQLQISESGVMSITECASSLDKLVDSLAKPEASDSKESQKLAPANKKEISGVEQKSEADSTSSHKGAEASSLPAITVSVRSEEKSVDNNTVVKTEQVTAKTEAVGTESKSVKTEPKAVKSESKVKEVSLTKSKDDSKKVEEKKVTLETNKSAPAVSSNANAASQSPKMSTASISTHHIIPLQRVSAPSVSVSPVSSSFKPTVPHMSAPPPAPQLCVTLGSSQVTLSISPSPSATSSASIPPANLSTAKATSSALTTTTVARTAPVPVPKPVQATSVSKKSSSSPVGYKTLKCGPKNWNPTISRNSFLSSKAEQQPQQQGSSSGTGSTSTGQGKPAAPPRFFKMRNTPRYLGNPASGVKAMYQVPDTKPETPAPAKSPSIMKLDPRTLTPIVSNASSPTSKSAPAQPKGRPPFPSTTLSAQVSNNHMPSSRSVTATTTTSSSSTKHADLSSLRSSTSQAMVNPYLSNPFMKRMPPNLLYGVLPHGVPFANMGLGYPPVTGTGFHANLPQSMLFNPHALHSQISSAPGSPTGYPSSLPSSPSMSLSPSSSSSSSSSSMSSKNYSASQRLPSSSEKSNTPSTQSSPSHINRNTAVSSNATGLEPEKVNGSEASKSSCVNQDKHPSSMNQERRTDIKAKAFTPPVPKDVKTSTVSLSASNNNNTVSISKAKSPSDKTDGGKLSLDVSNLISKESGKCVDDKVVSKSKSPTNTTFQIQQS